MKDDRNLEMLDILNIMSFVIGLMNYQENLAQTTLGETDRTVETIIKVINRQIEYQNGLLERILGDLEEMKLNEKN